jgi:hypothetical protein
MPQPSQHPLRSLGLAIALIGCDYNDDPLLGPRLMVLRADAVGWQFDCNARCPDVSDPTVVDLRCPNREPMSESALAENCTFQGGMHRVYVIADLSEIPELARDPAKAAFTASLTLDGDNTITKTAKLGPLQSYPPKDTESDKKDTDYYVAGYLDLPIDRAGVFRLRVASDEKPEFFVEAPDPLTLTPPSIAVSYTGCGTTCDEPSCKHDCELPAGAGKIGIDVTLVPDFPLNLVRVRGRIDGLLVEDAPWATDMTRATQQQRTFSSTRNAPNRPGTIWEVQVDTGDTSTPSGVRRIKLREPAPLRLAVVPGTELPDYEAGTTLRRARFEPDATCRALNVGVRSDDLPTGTAITLATSLGIFEGQASSIEKALADNRTLTTKLILPASIDLVGSATSLTVTVSNTLQGTHVRQVALAPILPVQAAFAAANTKVVVSNSGSAGAQLKGFATPPLGVSKFVPGVRLQVQVTATPEDGPALPCGDPVAPEVLACDPQQAGSMGGCLATPREVMLAEDGSFTIPIDAGLCFRGKLNVTVRGEHYVDNAPCLGERMTEVDVLDSALVSFAPAP